ncbi:C40 family peptidase [Brevibacillus sp. SIMBA_040]|uniref:C40 family peptidase n=1 Tax=unclassified Brevibacillus TaxID=2684853 RepID=UPI00397CC341
MIKRNWKGTTNTVLAILIGTSLLFGVGGQAYAAKEKSHKSQTEQKQQKKTKKKKKKKQKNQEITKNNSHAQNSGNTQNKATKKKKANEASKTAKKKKKNNNQLNATQADTFAAKATAKSASSQANKASQVISTGLRYKGVPYKFGSSKNTTRTFDCSSFTQRVFKQVGIKLPRDSRQQSKVGKHVSKGRLKKGDLVFFRSYGSASPRITHVAIYAGNNTLLHTYGRPGVTTTKFRGTSWEQRFEGARRVL